jgi:hypothetical protein
MLGLELRLEVRNALLRFHLGVDFRDCVRRLQTLAALVDKDWE